MPAEQSHAEIVATLTSRWPEHRVAPSLGRIRALTELLGDPQRAYPVIQLTGTNGKGSTAAMIESLLRADGLRTGRFTSPHLISITERITLDGEPISDERFDEVWREIAPYVALVDERKIDGVSMTFFEIVTAMAYAAFADAPVGVAVVEVGLGGAWDATNVADAEVAVVTPIDLDHTHLLGSTIGEITREKAGIIKPGAHAILAGQSVEAAEILLARCAEVGALPQREGVDFGVIDRQLAVAGQLIRLSAADGPVDDVFRALAAVEAFLGLKALHADVVREGFAQVHFPGRLELVRRSPGVVLDAAHNPHGARAAAAGITEAFAFAPLIGVIAVMADKDARGILEVFEEIMNHVVITQVASTSRGMPAEALGEIAKEVFGASRVTVVPRLDDAIDQAVALAEVDVVGSPGVLITGSVVAIGEARTLLVKEEPMVRPGVSEDLDNVWDADYSEDGHEAGRDWR